MPSTIHSSDKATQRCLLGLVRPRSVWPCTEVIEQLRQMTATDTRADQVLLGARQVRFYPLTSRVSTKQGDHGALAPILAGVLAALLGAEPIGKIVEQLEGLAQFSGESVEMVAAGYAGTGQ